MRFAGERTECPYYSREVGSVTNERLSRAEVGGALELVRALLDDRGTLH
ncbi:MAG: hypothetical protein WA190_00085 [Usitatibacter sp.]